MTKRDEIINKLILTIGKEIDYWLLTENKAVRETEYGSILYRKMIERYQDLQSSLLQAVFGLAEVLKEEDENSIRYKSHNLEDSKRSRRKTSSGTRL